MSLVEGAYKYFLLSTKEKGDIDFKPLLTCYFSWHSIGYRQYAEVLKSVIISREYRVAVRETDKKVGTVKVHADRVKPVRKGYEN